MLKHSYSAVYDFNYHLVFVTKYRQPVFTTNELRDDMKQFLQDICKQRQIDIQHMEVMPDHIHLLISFKPELKASGVVKAIKGVTARYWFKKHPETKSLLWGGHLWSPSYFMATTGNVSTKIVTNYIEQQISRVKKQNKLTK